MKIFYITYSIRGKSGIERILVTKANYFAEHYKYNVNFITIDDYFDNNFYPIHKNITHHDLKLRGQSFREQSKKINSILKKEQPDVVLVGMDNFTSAFLPLFIKKTFPMILERHSIMNSDSVKSIPLKVKFKNKAKFFFLKLGAKSYDKLVLLSKEGLKDWGNNKNMMAINNPLTFFPKKSASLKNKKVLAVGRHDYMKGFDMLLEIWHKTSKKFPEWQLNIYGDGDLQKQLEKQIIDLDLTKSVNLCPPTKNINDVYLEASIFTLTSRSEGFGQVLVEAMSCGLPVVSFDCPTGPKDIITDKEDGFLIPVGDLDTYAKNLTKLMNSFELREYMGKAGKQNIARLNPKVIMAQWDTLFKELV